jgi:hypothetical protein
VTPQRMFIFGAAGLMVVSALPLALWPIEDGSAASVERPDAARPLKPVALVGEARARADRLGSRFQIGGAIVAQSEAAAEQPPRVVGLVRTGRRALAYIDGAEGARRLPIGATYGGWRLVAVSGNAATFDIGGRRVTVRLFQRAEGPGPGSEEAGAPIAPTSPVR